jgi:hypothetical protein
MAGADHRAGRRFSSAGQGLEYGNLFAHGMLIDTNLFATTFFTLTGFHGIHVIAGLLAMLMVLGLALAGILRANRSPRWDGGDLLALRGHRLGLRADGRLHPPALPMNTAQFLASAWVWSPLALCLRGCGARCLFAPFRMEPPRVVDGRGRGRFPPHAHVSARGAGGGLSLQRAHAAAHPAAAADPGPRAHGAAALRANARSESARLLNPAVCWGCGVAAMWVWHLPALCNAAAESRSVSAVQTLTLLALGDRLLVAGARPSETQRIAPLHAVLYLFAACIACTRARHHPHVLSGHGLQGISPSRGPARDRFAHRRTWGMTPPRDQQIGGLIMWVPMCLVYLGAIFGQLARWYAVPAETFHRQPPTL